MTKWRHSNWRLCKFITSHWRQCDVIMRSCACCGCSCLFEIAAYWRYATFSLQPWPCFRLLVTESSSRPKTYVILTCYLHHSTLEIDLIFWEYQRDRFAEYKRNRFLLIEERLRAPNVDLEGQYSRLSLSRNRRDPLKTSRYPYFDISDV